VCGGGYSVFKKNEIRLFAGKWIKLEVIMLSEIIQFHKYNSTCFLSLVEVKF
jgi:hypothetical protein